MHDTQSRGDRLLEEIKASRPRPGQFRLAGLLGATLLVAVLFGLARASGLSDGSILHAPLRQ